MKSQNPPWSRLGAHAAGLSLVALLGLAGTAEAQQKRPNVVMLMTDDTGWNDFGANGGARTSAIRPRTSIASPRKEPCSRVGMVRRVVPPATPRL
jgi:hypothetical protein